MTTIKELLGQGEVKKHRKNFLQENIKRLKEIKIEKGNKLNSRSNKSAQFVHGRQSAQENSKRPLSQRQNKASLPSTRKLGLTYDETASKTYRSQECQTLDSKQLENMYSEGVVRYPSCRSVTPALPPDPVANTTEQTLESSSISLQCDVDKNMEASKDIMKPSTKTTEAKPDPNRPPLTYQRGVVPRYLKIHKKEMEKERLSRAQEAAGECPEGHLILPDDIRLAHLTTLNKKYEELVSQLNHLPVSTDTLKTRNRKKQIEAELDKIEAAITLFSREKVFVKANS